MKLMKTINGWRGRIMRGVTRSISTASVTHQAGSLVKTDVSRILICRPNHRLGNLLLITPLLQEVARTFPQARIDLFVKGNAGPMLFKNYDNVGLIIQLPKRPFKNFFKYATGWIKLRSEYYDIVINTVNHSASGRLAAKFARSKFKFLGDINVDVQRQHHDHEHMAKYPVYSFRRYLSQLGHIAPDEVTPSLDLKLSPQEIEEGKSILLGLVNNYKKTICLFTYATGAKCYSSIWWEDFYNRLKQEYSACNIIEVLPIENVSQISFKAPTFFSDDIRQMGSVISNADVFIGADSGVMHLASSVHVPTIGLFQITSLETYQPYDNNSTGINTNKVTLNELIEIITGVLVQTSK